MPPCSGSLTGHGDLESEGQAQPFLTPGEAQVIWLTRGLCKESSLLLFLIGFVFHLLGKWDIWEVTSRDQRQVSRQIVDGFPRQKLLANRGLVASFPPLYNLTLLTLRFSKIMGKASSGSRRCCSRS